MTHTSPRCMKCKKLHAIGAPCWRGSYIRIQHQLYELVNPVHVCWLGYAGVCNGRAVELDHVIPRSEGGADAPENYRWCCKPCNSARAAREPFSGRPADIIKPDPSAPLSARWRR